MFGRLGVLCAWGRLGVLGSLLACALGLELLSNERTYDQMGGAVRVNLLHNPRTLFSVDYIFPLYPPLQCWLARHLSLQLLVDRAQH